MNEVYDGNTNEENKSPLSVEPQIQFEKPPQTKKTWLLITSITVLIVALLTSLYFTKNQNYNQPQASNYPSTSPTVTAIPAKPITEQNTCNGIKAEIVSESSERIIRV